MTPERIEQEVTGAFDQIVEVLTTAAGTSSIAPVPQSDKPADRLKIEAPDSYGAFENMNRQFLEEEWGDGFLLTPPTPEKVELMLKGTTLDRNHAAPMSASRKTRCMMPAAQWKGCGA